MKKLSLIILTIILVTAAGCGSSNGTEPQPTSTDYSTYTQAHQETTSPTELPFDDMLCDPPPSGEIFVPWDNIEDIPQVAYDLAVYSSVEELYDEAAYIFIASVKDIEVEQLDEKEDWDTEETVYTTKVWYKLDVRQSIKGDIEEDGADIYEQGHSYGSINFYHEYFPPMCFGKTYLMFAYDTKRLCSPFVGYTEIIDEKMVSGEHNDLFNTDASVEDVIKYLNSITVVVNAPEKILVDEGMQNLMQAISDEPDFTPVRDLTKDEIDLLYRFYNDNLALEYKGKELQNGDKVIWIKTERLTKQQIDVYQSSLDAATSAIASERESHYKVTTTQYHTLITICKYNEDNATIHDAFCKIVNGTKE